MASIFSLAGRTALVTGASSGLGRRFAATLAAHGARVALAARRRERLDELAGEIGTAGGVALAVEMDVADEASVAAGFDAAEQAFGTVDILVNNAGVGARRRALEMEMAEWREVMAVNLDAAFSVARQAGRRMSAARRGGAIVNVASVLGFAARRGFTAYGASKAAVIQMTRMMALELGGDAIRVNAVAPGYFATEMTAAYVASEAGARMIGQLPLNRLGQPGDLDGAVLLLVSDAGAYITGHTLVIDGGHSLVIP